MTRSSSTATSQETTSNRTRKVSARTVVQDGDLKVGDIVEGLVFKPQDGVPLQVEVDGRIFVLCSPGTFESFGGKPGTCFTTNSTPPPGFEDKTVCAVEIVKIIRGGTRRRPKTLCFGKIKEMAPIVEPVPHVRVSPRDKPREAPPTFESTAARQLDLAAA